MWAKGARGQTEPQSTFCYNVHVKHAQISNHDISVKQKASDYSVSTFFPYFWINVMTPSVCEGGVNQKKTGQELSIKQP